MTHFLECILRDHPELQEEIERFRSRGAAALFASKERSHDRIQYPLSTGVPEKEKLDHFRFTQQEVAQGIEPETEASHYHIEYLCRQTGAFLRAYEQSVLLSGGLPISIIEPPSPNQTPREYEQRHTPVPLTPIHPAHCKFYSGNPLLRCAVNPCTKTCEGCTDFQQRGQN